VSCLLRQLFAAVFFWSSPDSILALELFPVSTNEDATGE
jgi:hypothetical protein